MYRALLNLLHLAWALWFGGMVVLLIFVTRLFHKSHATGVDAAPVLFDTFANYQLIVGAVACGASTALALMFRSKQAAVLTLGLLMAFAAAILLRGWTHQIDWLQQAGQASSAAFKHLHAKTGIAYVTAATALLISGLGWRNLRLPRQTTAGTAPATHSRASATARS